MWAVRLWSDERDFRRERGSPGWVRVPVIAGDLRTGGGWRRCYSDSWTTATSRQDAGGRGGLGCMVSFLDCFQMRKGATARDDAGWRRCREMMESSFSCILAPGRHVRRRARGRKKGGISRESAEVFHRPGISGKWWRQRRAPTGDFGQPGGSLVELEEGKRRGEWGIFIGVAKHRLRHGVTENWMGEESYYTRWSRAGKSLEEEEPDSGGHASVRGKEKSGTDSEMSRWATGCMRDWADSESRGPFRIFLFFFYLLFLS
jgi:hypothetical protein